MMIGNSLHKLSNNSPTASIYLATTVFVVVQPSLSPLEWIGEEFIGLKSDWWTLPRQLLRQTRCVNVLFLSPRLDQQCNGMLKQGRSVVTSATGGSGMETWSEVCATMMVILFSIRHGECSAG